MDFALWKTSSSSKFGKRFSQSKLRALKRKGMGNKPNASAALSEEDIQVLFEKDL